VQNKPLVDRGKRVSRVARIDSRIKHSTIVAGRSHEKQITANRPFRLIGIYANRPPTEREGGISRDEESSERRREKQMETRDRIEKNGGNERKVRMLEKTQSQRKKTRGSE